MFTDTRETIGQRLKRHRKDRGLSQNELAEGICSSSTISLLETDQHVPAAGIMQQLAEKLGMTMHELVEGQAEVLDVSLQLDVIEILVETEDYEAALPMIRQLEISEELAEYQRRNVTLNLAECFMRTGEPGRAVELLSEMQQTLEQQREPDTRLMATLNNKLGNAYYLASNMAYAHANYLRAYQITLRFPEFDLLSAQISYNLASTCRLFCLFGESILHFKYAYEYFSKNADQKRLARTTFCLGLTYKNMGEFERAKECFQQSLSIYQAENMITLARHVRQQYAIDVLGSQEPASAINELIRCAEEYKTNGDIPRQAYSHARIADLYLQQNRFEDSCHAIKKAIHLIAEHSELANPIFPYVYRVYANYWYFTQEYEQAIHYAYKSNEIFSKMALEKEAADSLKVAVNAYRKKENKDGVIQTLERLAETLDRAFEKPLGKMGEYR